MIFTTYESPSAPILHISTFWGLSSQRRKGQKSQNCPSPSPPSGKLQLPFQSILGLLLFHFQILKPILGFPSSKSHSLLFSSPVVLQSIEICLLYEILLVFSFSCRQHLIFTV
ncbi:hypothetical protein MRB53_013328 [Persea americana]|uniref:Uncharacterized protein n=1 Tax=Persea americana TaxID=3435 RepID=A0ACC2K7Q8_PERAE|nr:hypothetical protein MRB53_013328 [Persea americana]